MQQLVIRIPPAARSTDIVNMKSCSSLFSDKQRRFYLVEESSDKIPVELFSNKLAIINKRTERGFNTFAEVVQEFISSPLAVNIKMLEY